MVRIGIPRESQTHERRVAAVPSVVSTFTERGWDVVVETDAGTAAGFPDAAYTDAGATIVDRAAAHDADLILRVGPPDPLEVELIPQGSIVAGFLEPFTNEAVMRAILDGRISAVALEAVPRTTLAQSMDALSSQATVAGYAAVLMAAARTPRFFPMLVTAAGTIPPARVLILGAGVAGLQAIATARRLGARVSAYDIRQETKEQVESLGARFVAAPTQEADAGGYAGEVGADVQAQQHAVLAPHVAEADVVVTTAQIPGRPAPLLVTEEMVRSMKAGSVIVDMAAGTGGNVATSKPDETVTLADVIILGPTNLAATVPGDASRMFARNLEALIERMAGEGEPAIDLGDEIISEACVVHDGAAIHPRTADLLGVAAAPSVAPVDEATPSEESS